MLTLGLAIWYVSAFDGTSIHTMNNEIGRSTTNKIIVISFSISQRLVLYDFIQSSCCFLALRYVPETDFGHHKL